MHFLKLGLKPAISISLVPILGRVLQRAIETAINQRSAVDSEPQLDWEWTYSMLKKNTIFGDVCSNLSFPQQTVSRANCIEPKTISI
jgi:hypothetical protein